jgi:DNA-directed RNA polymerase specialized sigma subunit
MSMIQMNFDISSYNFEDLDLKIAVSRLSEQDQNILVLSLMGHTQRDIAMVSGGVTRSMISKRLRIIMKKLARYL